MGWIAHWGAALLTSTTLAALAVPARAQEWRASGGGDGGARGGTGFGMGFEIVADLRELNVDSYKENYNGPPNPSTTPPPPATEWDEDLIEHRIQYQARHYGAMVHAQAVGAGNTPWRFGARVGAVTATIREEVFGPAFLYGTSPVRFTLDIESKTGIGGGLFGDVRVPIQGQPIWFGAGIDTLVGQVSMDNGAIFDTAASALDGTYLFAWGTVLGRVGFTQNGVSPFVGVGASYYYGDLELDAVPEPVGNGLKSHEAKFSTRQYLRVFVGIEVGKGAESLGRLQVGIGKPGDDLAVSMVALFRV